MPKEKRYRPNEVITAGAARYAIVAARFNIFIVDRLLQGAHTTLVKHGATEEHLTIVRVPGAFEIPLICQALAKTSRYDAILALGCVIRGDTPHFDYVCSESARGISEVALKYHIPVVYGILTTDNVEQALARANTDGGDNKGVDAAFVAMEMVGLLNRVKT